MNAESISKELIELSELYNIDIHYDIDDNLMINSAARTLNTVIKKQLD
jgi:hypothetical protein